MRIVYWGTYDIKRERYRVLIDAFKQNGIDILECHDDVWAGIRDKSMVSSWRSRFRICIKYIFAYPKLTFRYLCLPDHDAVLVGYLGHFDVLVLWPFAKLRRKPIVWDALTSLYEEIITDRKFISATRPLARMIFAIEWLICHSADRIFVPSAARAHDFSIRYRLPEKRTRVVFLGVENIFFPPRKPVSKSYSEDDSLSVLFYGSFIPLHGVETIIRAARLMKDDRVNWTIIGRGQVESIIHEMLTKQPLPRLQRIHWVAYRKLSYYIHHSDIALGIFGDSQRAATSIPNKVFQILSSGTPLITRDSPAIREILEPTMPGIYLIQPNSPKALVRAIQQFRSERKMVNQINLHIEISPAFHPDAIGKRIASLITECI